MHVSHVLRSYINVLMEESVLEESGASAWHGTTGPSVSAEL